MATPNFKGMSMYELRGWYLFTQLDKNSNPDPEQLTEWLESFDRLSIETIIHCLKLDYKDCLPPFSKKKGEENE